MLPQGGGHLFRACGPRFDQDAAEFFPWCGLLLGQGVIQMLARNRALVHQDFTDRAIRHVPGRLNGFDARHHRCDIQADVEWPTAFHAGLNTLDQPFEQVHGVENHIDHVTIDDKLAAADLVQQVLRTVGQAVDAHESQKTGHAFDGVKGSENRVDALLLRVVLLKVDQADLDRFQALQGFDDKPGNDLAVFLIHIGLRAAEMLGRRRWRYRYGG